ncbi:hypothetical protein BU26DRAFT_118382 [Trematosphaeria pertusa]|uniref:Uncharacterized protein n=1 Tax=Trematosphaeria pertusa TaxID=390896 RepID=A0A6A6I1K7_9PLEO|nr:uncharacterized protein BU26DRAFT_118382 [Trematosphaeria pertusa]KAF2243470.1 hypothetical protein BU26DRAFT_118382 [Trematosphaeria pertusa]
MSQLAQHHSIEASSLQTQHPPLPYPSAHHHLHSSPSTSAFFAATTPTAHTRTTLGQIASMSISPPPIYRSLLSPIPFSPPFSPSSPPIPVVLSGCGCGSGCFAGCASPGFPSSRLAVLCGSVSCVSVRASVAFESNWLAGRFLPMNLELEEEEELRCRGDVVV